MNEETFKIIHTWKIIYIYVYTKDQVNILTKDGIFPHNI